ncbi:caspase-3-like [Branchiostoma floridae]|uniref:Caspase-3-like n=1 Tax=Branchiostoma floridae TaxID=7739 RepID=A0A9J7LJ89_BRAFL|nr:caspase-3-like [Branchiostoma floridae]
MSDWNSVSDSPDIPTDGPTSTSTSNDDKDQGENEEMEEQEESMDEDETYESPRPSASLTDQIKAMQQGMTMISRNMSYLMQRATREEEDRKRKIDSLKDSLDVNESQLKSLKGKKKKLEANLLKAQECSNAQRVATLYKTINTLQTTIFSSFYPIRNRFKTNGRVMMINTHFTVKEMEERSGAERDTQKLEEAFKSLQVNTEVKPHQNLKLPEMLKALKEEANRDHDNEDFFVCCIMSHGTQGKVYASDGFSIDILDILSLFKEKRCSSLMSKPKLFFIQACQGDKEQEIAGPYRDAFNSPSLTQASYTTEADFLIALATVPGYVAYRGEDGADFVNVLARVLKEHGKSQDLMSMMTIVSEELNNKYGNSPFCSTTLRRKLFFTHNLPVRPNTES